MRSALWMVVGPLMALAAPSAAPTRVNSPTLDVSSARSAKGGMNVALCAAPVGSPQAPESQRTQLKEKP